MTAVDTLEGNIRDELAKAGLDPEGEPRDRDGGWPLAAELAHRLARRIAGGAYEQEAAEERQQRQNRDLRRLADAVRQQLREERIADITDEQALGVAAGLAVGGWEQPAWMDTIFQIDQAIGAARRANGRHILDRDALADAVEYAKLLGGSMAFPIAIDEPDGEGFVGDGDLITRGHLAVRAGLAGHADVWAAAFEEAPERPARAAAIDPHGQTTQTQTWTARAAVADRFTARFRDTAVELLGRADGTYEIDGDLIAIGRAAQSPRGNREFDAVLPDMPFSDRQDAMAFYADELVRTIRAAGGRLGLDEALARTARDLNTMASEIRWGSDIARARGRFDTVDETCGCCGARQIIARVI